MLCFFSKTCRWFINPIRTRFLMIFIETKVQFFFMKVTKSAVGMYMYGCMVVWWIFCNCFSTTIYKDVIFVDAQKLEAKERDAQYQDITFKPQISWLASNCDKLKEYRPHRAGLHMYMYMAIALNALFVRLWVCRIDPKAFSVNIMYTYVNWWVNELKVNK